MPIGAPEDRAYLSILSWPDGPSEDQHVELLVCFVPPPLIDDGPRFEFSSAWTMLMLRECLA